jgi:hypothetical protein
MIYFFEMTVTPPAGPAFTLLKIGYTNDLWRRFRKLNDGLPFPLEVLGAVKGDYQKEQELHRQFADQRVSRDHEWFYDHPKLRRYIARHKVSRFPDKKTARLAHAWAGA